jgi:hypothetical protein
VGGWCSCSTWQYQQQPQGHPAPVVTAGWWTQSWASHGPAEVRRLWARLSLWRTCGTRRPGNSSGLKVGRVTQASHGPAETPAAGAPVVGGCVGNSHRGGSPLALREGGPSHRLHMALLRSVGRWEVLRLGWEGGAQAPSYWLHTALLRSVSRACSLLPQFWVVRCLHKETMSLMLAPAVLARGNIQWRWPCVCYRGGGVWRHPVGPGQVTADLESCMSRDSTQALSKSTQHLSLHCGVPSKRRQLFLQLNQVLHAFVTGMPGMPYPQIHYALTVQPWTSKRLWDSSRRPCVHTCMAE